MRKKKFFWQIYPSYLLVTLLSLFAVTFYALHALHQFYIQQLAKDLEAKARLVAHHAQLRFSPLNAAYLDVLSKQLGRKTKTRITFIFPSGKVAGDSSEDPVKMDNHAHRPEVQQALQGRTGSSTRFSHTVNKDMMYIAIPVKKYGKVAGVVRTSVAVASVEDAFRAIRVRIVFGGMVVAVFSAIVSLFVSGRVSRPLEGMKEGAKRFAEGDLEYRLPIPHSEEAANLTEALNQMAAQLHQRIRSVIEQRNELEAVLTSMVEGVMIVDAEERLMSVNQTAARWLNVQQEQIKGKSIQEAIRNTDLQKFVSHVLTSQEPLEEEVSHQDAEERFLQAHGTVLRDADGKSIGSLIVLNDVTRLRVLEKVRRDFVANVSHELKTPVTSIKGFVETLLDGAVISAKDTKRFLELILKNADRLNAILEDLLSLSRIEIQAEERSIALERVSVKNVLKDAIADCDYKIRDKKMKIELLCEDDTQALANAPLLEQAVVNLIDNAIKYSDAGSMVHVSAQESDSVVVITIRDEGCGIEKEYLPRLFERFYRVDKARSRKLGGTGLGLAIVKHIALAHGGSVHVESAPGTGSTFHIRLPLKTPGLYENTT